MKKAIAQLKSITQVLALNAGGIEKWVEKFAKGMGLKVIDYIFDKDKFAVRLGTTDYQDAHDFGQSLLGMGKKFGFKDLDVEKGSKYTDVWFKIK